MKVNEGGLDRTVRGLLGAGILYLAVSGAMPSGGLTLLAGLVGGVLLLTAAMGFCPAYTLFGIDTCKVRR